MFCLKWKMNLSDNLIHSWFLFSLALTIKAEYDMESVIKTALDAAGNIDMDDSFYKYSYDGTGYYVKSGGNAMYDGSHLTFQSNKVSFSEVNLNGAAEYGKIYRYPNYVFGTKASSPFIALMAIDNQDEEFHNYRLQVSGYPRALLSGYSTTHSDVLIVDQTMINYYVIEYYSDARPTVCEIYFTMDNTASPNYEFAVEPRSDNDSFSLNVARITGAPKDVLLVYVLISKSPGHPLTTFDIQNIIVPTARSFNRVPKTSDTVAYTGSLLRLFAEQISVEISEKLTYPTASSWVTGFSTILGGAVYSPWGNKVVSSEDISNTERTIFYEQEKCYQDFCIGTRANHPFTALMWIDSPDYNIYSIKVTSYANLYGNESYTEYHGHVDVLGSNVTYDVTHIHGRMHPSICEVYFQVINKQEWNSDVFDSKYDVTFDDSYYLSSTILFSGRIRRVLLGYFLLSKYPGNGLISEVEVQNLLTSIVSSVTNSFQHTTINKDQVIRRRKRSLPDYSNATHIVSSQEQEVYSQKENTEKKRSLEEKTQYENQTIPENEPSLDFTSSVHSIEDVGSMQEWNSRFVNQRNYIEPRYSQEILDLFDSSGSGAESTTEDPTTAPTTKPTTTLKTTVKTTTLEMCLAECDGCNGPCSRGTSGECICSCIPGYTLNQPSSLGCLPVQCPKETLLFPGDNTTSVTFPVTQAGYTATSVNKCPEGLTNAGKPYGNRKCGLSGNWTEPTWLSSCNTGVQDILDTPITTNEERETAANDLEIITSEPESLTTEDVTDTTEALAVVVNTTTLTPKASSSVVATVGNLLEAPEEVLAGQTDVILETLDSVGEKVELDEGDTYEEVSSSVAVAVVRPTQNDADNGVGYGATRLSLNKTGFRSDQLSTFIQQPTADMTSYIVVPGAATKGVTDRRISFTAFPDAKLFQSNVKSYSLYNNATVNSDVILSATVVNTTAPITDLETPVEMQFGIKEMIEEGTSVCVYWDENDLTWSDSGSTLTNVTNTSVTCTFNHLTNFATLFLPGSIDPTTEKTLDIITLIGCSISAFSCVLLILVFIFVPKTRTKGRKKAAVLLLNLSIAILLLDVFIIVSEQSIVTSSETSCLAISVLIYFSLMSVFTWMMVEGFSIFFIVLFPFQNRRKLFGKWFMVGANVWGWLVPALVITFTTIFNLNMYKRPDGECYIQPDLVLYAVLIPAAIALGINLFLYIFVVYKVTCAKRPQHMAGKTPDLVKNMVFSLTLFVTLGLTWIFGFGIIDPGTNSDVSFAFSIIFTVFNSLQGLFLFLLFVIRQKFTRSAVVDQARRISAYAIPSSTRSTGTRIRQRRNYSSSSTFHDNDAYDAEIENWRSETSHGSR